MRKLVPILTALTFAIPAFAQAPGNEYSFRAPARFYKRVTLSMGAGALSGLPQMMSAEGKLQSLSATFPSATTGAQLTSVVMPPNTLVQPSEKLHIRIFGRAAANANTKQVQFLFGSTTITLLNAASNAKDFYADIEIYRTAKNAQQITVAGYANGSLLDNLSVTSAQTETSAIAVSVNLPTATANNDVVLTGFTVEGEARG